MAHIDQVVVGIREEGRPFERTCPLSGWVGRRDELRLDLGRRAKGRVVQRGHVLLHRPAGRSRIELLLPLYAWDRTLTVGVGFDQARIDGETLAANQADLDARSHDALEDAPEDIALAEALIAGARERRMVRDGVFQAQVTEPPVGEVDSHLAAD